MFFTREDILKIQNALLQLSIKDSELPSAEPVTYDDTLSIVQDGKNKKIKIEDFFNQISLWKREDFINITDRYDEHYIMLLEAINLVPILQRKDGLVITFQDVEGNWEIYQFRGNITEFFNIEKWFNLYDYRNNIIQSIVPDEEDLTVSTPNENGNSLVSLKNRVYDPTSFSGKGYKILRKNIQPVDIVSTKINITKVPSSDGILYFTINDKNIQVTVSSVKDNTTSLVAQKIASTLKESLIEYEVLIDTSLITLKRKSSGLVTPSTFSTNTTGVVCTITDSTKREFRNILTQDMINQPNTIYEIRYDFDLDDITLNMLPNSVLKFIGGIIRNGKIVGAKTSIINSSNIEIFNKITFEGIWNVAKTYPEWFGAKGDGITDDTDAISCAAFMAQGSTLAFMPKTYIINVKQGKDKSTPRSVIASSKFSNLYGNGAILKLGDNDNCNLLVNKGFSQIFYVIQRNVIIKDITIDFNYDKNPIYQTIGISQNIEVNMQQDAFIFRGTNTLIVDNCTFIEHSGSNCLDYAAYDNINNSDLYVRVSNCRFIACGKKSYFVSPDGVVNDAAHDVSTMAIHYRENFAKHKFKLDVCNNYFEGVGPNAYNALECSPHIFNYNNNVVIGFDSAILPCFYHDNIDVNVFDNKFYKMSCPIRIWNKGYKENVSVEKEVQSCNTFIVKNNIAKIDILYQEQKKNYNSIYINTYRYYNFINIIPGSSRNFGGELVIKQNDIEYVNPMEVKEYFKDKEIGTTSAVLDFSKYGDKALYDSSLSSLIIEGNKIHNSVCNVLYNACFAHIHNFSLKDNAIIKPCLVTGEKILYFVTSQYYDFGRGAIGNIEIINNYIDNRNIEYTSSKCILHEMVSPYKLNDFQVKIVNGNVVTKKAFPLINPTKGDYDIAKLNQSDIFFEASGHSSIPTDLDNTDLRCTYFDQGWRNMMFWNGQYFVNGFGQTSALRYGSFNSRPTNLRADDEGYLYYDETNKRLLYWNGTSWNGLNNELEDVKSVGKFSEKPTEVKKGFIYFNTDTHKQITWDGSKWWNPDGTEATS